LLLTDQLALSWTRRQSGAITLLQTVAPAAQAIYRKLLVVGATQLLISLPDLSQFDSLFRCQYLKNAGFS
jgi:hypothetical protein